MFFSLILSMKGEVQIYKNLHKTSKQHETVYSVRNAKNIVEDHATEVTLIDPKCRVGKKGRERVRKEKRKNVHAYVQGKRMKGVHGQRGSNWRKVTYNPYKHENFVLADDNSAIVTGAVLAHLDGEGVWVLEPNLRFENLLEV